MYIHHKPAAAFYKLAIGAVALCLEWYLLGQFGWAALRLFPVWVLILTAIYFLISALLLAISHKKVPGKNPAPVFEGMIIVNFILMFSVAILSVQHRFALPHLETWVVWLICFVLPVMTFLDWLLFVKKGRWKIMAPFYWLALPVCYVATMIFTADFLPNNAELIYPLAAFNYYEFGLWDFCELALAASLGVLLVGYILYLIDFIMSGKLAKNVVLPHIQVIEVEEEVPAESVKGKTIEKVTTEDKTKEVKKVEHKETNPEPKTEVKSENTKPNSEKVQTNSNKSTQPKTSNQKSTSSKKPRQIKVNQNDSKDTKNYHHPRKNSAAGHQRKPKK